MNIDSSKIALTPSEIFFLSAESFVSFGAHGFPLLHSEHRVCVEELTRGVLSMALLSLESAGELELAYQVVDLRLCKSATVKLIARVEDSRFPEPSLEEQLLELARVRGLFRNGCVYELICAWLDERGLRGWSEVLDAVSQNLAERSLLVPTQRRWLWILQRTSYLVPEATRALTREAPIGALLRLISNTKTERPDLWDELNEELSTAVLRPALDDDFSPF